MATFEERLSSDFGWALDEADRYFSGSGFVRQALRALASRLDAIGVEFAVVGAVAMFCHGYRRFTQDVDILVTAEGLAEIDLHLLGDGYERPSEWRRGIRECDSGVAIHIFVSGSPCGAEPNYVTPHPAERSTSFDGIKVLDLAAILEMKFALGTNPGQKRHLGDAQELIRYSDIPLDFAAALLPQFRNRFAEYWNHAQVAKTDDY